VSALDFLSVSSDSSELIARTPMEHLAAESGARFERLDGWNVAVAFGEPAAEQARVSESVGFADRSNLAKFELNAPATAIATLGLKLGIAEARDGAWWCPITPERVLAFGEPSGVEALRSSVNALGGHVTDLTSGLCAMTLVGPLSRELLARFCAIDVRPAVAPVRSFRPGSIARTPGYLLVEGEDRLLIMVGWALGQYLYEVVADAAEQLGGGPVGADALGSSARA
jgi:glycine cleavage system aminomethyltransferase T